MTGALQRFLVGLPPPGSTPCCSGIFGSHEHLCPSMMDHARRGNAGDAVFLTCWCCGGLFPPNWSALWSSRGSRCQACGLDNPHHSPCRAHVGEYLQPYRLNTQGIPI